MQRHALASVCELQRVKQRVRIVSAGLPIEENSNDCAQLGRLVLVVVHDVQFQVVVLAIYGVLGGRVEMELQGREQTLGAVSEVDLELSVG